MASLAVCLPASVEAQRAFYLASEEGPELVRKVTRSHYHYGANTEYSKRIGEVPTRLHDYPAYVPGYVEVRSHRLTNWTILGNHVGQSDVQSILVDLRIRANRDLEEVYLIVHWYLGGGREFRIVGSVGSMRAGRTQSVDYEVEIPRIFEEARYRLSFYSGGVEIRSFLSDATYDTTVDTPFERYIQSLGESPPDGHPQVLHLVEPQQLPPVPDGTSRRISALVDIDAAGYVKKVNIEQSPGSEHSVAVKDALRLWEFKPRIRDGKPVPTQIRVPFDL